MNPPPPASTTTTTPPTTTTTTNNLSPIEKEILQEYTRLLQNLNDLSMALNELAERPTTEILDSLRGLERKITVVCTALKASVYSIVLQG